MATLSTGPTPGRFPATPAREDTRGQTGHAIGATPRLPRGPRSHLLWPVGSRLQPMPVHPRPREARVHLRPRGTQEREPAHATLGLVFDSSSSSGDTRARTGEIEMRRTCPPRAGVSRVPTRMSALPGVSRFGGGVLQVGFWGVACRSQRPVAAWGFPWFIYATQRVGADTGGCSSKWGSQGTYPTLAEVNRRQPIWGGVLGSDCSSQRPLAAMCRGSPPVPRYRGTPGSKLDRFGCEAPVPRGRG